MDLISIFCKSYSRAIRFTDWNQALKDLDHA